MNSPPLPSLQARQDGQPSRTRSQSRSRTRAGSGPGSGSGSASRAGSRSKRLLLAGGLLAAGTAAGVAARRLAAARAEIGAELSQAEAARVALGWGDGVARPDHRVVRTPDGAELAVWDLEGGGPEAPAVVLPHCWGCSHEVWLPVARRLREGGHRVVLYDQRGHGLSSRGTAPLAIETLAHDLEAVLVATDVRDAVLAGHSMGGMTIMSLATHRSEVLQERAKGVVLVATAATNAGARAQQGVMLARAVLASSLVGRALQSRNGHVFVRGAFGTTPVRAHLDLTRELFGGCDADVRAGWLVAMASMNVLEGIASIEVPTTVMVGSRDTLTLPRKADEIVSAIPGARLVTLEGRGHMLPLEDPDAVTDEILRTVKG